MSQRETGIMDRRDNAWWLALGISIPGIIMGHYELVWVVLFVIAIIYISRLSTRTKSLRVEYHRKHASKSMESQFVPVDINIENRTRQNLFHLTVTDHFTVNSAVHRVGHLAGNHSLLLRYAMGTTSRRGHYLTGPGKIEVTDVFGLTRNQLHFPEYLPLTIYPQINMLDWLPQLDDATHRSIGSDIAPRGGGGEELMTLRNYVPGDSPRRVHWPSSARQRHLMVKQFEENITTEVTCLCDVTLLSQTGIGQHNSTEYRIRLAAAMADEVIARNHYFRLALIGEDVQSTSMAGGKRQLTQVLEMLTLAKASGMAAFDARVQEWLPQLKRNGTLLLVTGSLRNDLRILTETAMYLKHRHMRLMVIIVDDQSFTRVQMEHEYLFQYAPTAATTAEELRLLGADVHTVSQFDSEVQLRSEL